MENEEIRSTIEQIKAQVKAKPENKDKTDDDIDAMILDAFLKAYNDGEMTKEDLLGLAEAMGYEPTEEFLNDQNAGENAPADDGVNKGEDKPADGATQEELENARTIEPGQTAEEFKQEVDEIKEGNNPNPAPAPAPASGSAPEENGEEDDDDDGESEEDAERKKASELWKMNLNK